MDIFEKITQFFKTVFKTDLEIFFEALKLSPNAQGYVSGSITELLLKKKLEDEYCFEVRRIKEKWEGKKHPNHHGDFYFREPDSDNWFVIESKGVKSNSEKWHKLYNLDKLIKFLKDHKDKINWLEEGTDTELQIISWINTNLPKFSQEYRSNLDVHNAMIDERLNYVRSKVKVLETHFVAGKSGKRTQATHRKDEFNAISIDIFLRYTEHKLLFVNPKSLESSKKDPNHLKQNYIMGFVFTNAQGNETLSLTKKWHENFMDVYKTIEPEDSINEGDMQIDNRILFSDDQD